MVKKTNSDKTIPQEVKLQVDSIVKEFNEKVISNPHYRYLARYKSNYLYLDCTGYQHRVH